MGVPARPREGALADECSMLDRSRAWPVNELARGVYAGRVAIWGVVVPLAALVIMWCAILIGGDEDAALAFGARWGTVFAWWLGGTIAVFLSRRITSHSRLARRRRARREQFHRLLTEEYGRPSVGRSPQTRPALTLAEVIVAIMIALMILSLATPSAGSPSEEEFLLVGLSCIALGAVGLLVAVAFRRRAERENACQERLDKWKTRHDVRHAEKTRGEAKGVR